MKKQKTYWCGFHKGRPHVSEVDLYVHYESGGFTPVKGVYIYMTKKEALRQGFGEIRKVKIVEVK